MAGALAWAIQIALVVLLAAAITYLVRRPRLSAEASLRGGTRTGKLYVVVTNRGGIRAHRVRLEVAWVGDDDRRAPIDALTLGTLAPADALRVEVRDLHRPIEAAPQGWRAIEARLVAANALPARALLPVATRAHEDEAAPPVRYAARDACPATPDGAHRFEARRLWNDGVTETWRLCARCRHVERDPLSDAEKATQARVRRERAERERRKVEEEWARREAEAAKERPRARPSGARTSWRHQEEPARDEDLFPPDVAFYVLELDPATAAWEDVAAAHRRLTLAHHPDRRHDLAHDARAAAERKMQEINAARDRLREHFGRKAPLE